MTHEPHNLEEVLEELEDLGDRRESVCFGDALDEFGHRSFGPLLVILPLIEITPLGGIPGVPSFLALVIAVVAAQLLFGRDHIWLPGFIERRAISGDRLSDGAHKLDTLAEKLDGWFHGRLKWLTKGIWPRVAALLILLLCLSVPPLEFLPFASSAPMIAIAAFGLALLVRDGLLMLVGMALTGGAAVLMFTALGPGGSGG